MEVIEQILKLSEVKTVAASTKNGERGVRMTFNLTDITLFICLEENGDGLQLMLFDGPSDIYRTFIPTR